VHRGQTTLPDLEWSVCRESGSLSDTAGSGACSTAWPITDKVFATSLAEQSIASSSHGLFPVRLLDPVPVVGIDVNDDDRSVARRDQRGLVEAGAAGLVGGFERRRLGKQQ